MAFDDTTPLGRTLAELNAELPSADVYRFPDAFVVRPPPGSRGDQVAVVHRSETTLYASPRALADAVIAADPAYAAAIAAAGEAARDARALQADAQLLLRAAKLAKAAAERRLERVGLACALAACLAAVIAVAFVL